MKNVGRYIAIVTISAGGHAWAAAPMCGQPGAASNPEFAAPRELAFPTFCAIPPSPKSVPSATAFKSAVVTTRLAGADVVRQTAPDTWSLGGSAGFIETARHEAEPPPPMTPPGASSTAAFVAASKAKAKPPPKPRHR